MTTPPVVATATLRRGDLAAAVKWAAAGIDRHPGLPVLAAAPVTLDEGQVTVTSYATGIARVITCDGDGTGGGLVLADGRSLAKALAGLPGRATTAVTLTIRPGGRLEVSSDGITVHVPATGPDHEYPQVPMFPGPAGAPADPVAFTALAAAAARCAAPPGPYQVPALTAVRLTAAAGTVTLAAADRRWLAYQASTGWDGPGFGPLLLPAATLAAFTAAADGSPIVVRCEQPADGNVIPIRRHNPPAPAGWQTGPWAELRDDRHMVTARAIDPHAKGGEYPDVTSAMRPGSDNSTVITTTAAALAAAAARIAKIGGTHALARVTAAGGTATIHAVGASGNEDQSAEHLPGGATGPDVVIHLEAQHITAVTAGASGSVRLGVTADRPADEGRPPLPSPVMVYGDSWTGVIQPQRNARHRAGAPASRAARLAAIHSVPAGE